MGGFEFCGMHGGLGEFPHPLPCETVMDDELPDARKMQQGSPRDVAPFDLRVCSLVPCLMETVTVTLT